MGWFSKKDDGFFLATITPPGIEASQCLGIVNGEAIIGANIFRDMFSSVRDVVAASSCRSSAPRGTGSAGPQGRPIGLQADWPS